MCTRYTKKRWNLWRGEKLKECYHCTLRSLTSGLISTSSTAQGGGGSFKNRKPIGEVGCCESRMAERSHWWSERWLISLTLSLSHWHRFRCWIWYSLDQVPFEGKPNLLNFAHCYGFLTGCLALALENYQYWSFLIYVLDWDCVGWSAGVCFLVAAVFLADAATCCLLLLVSTQDLTW